MTEREPYVDPELVDKLAFALPSLVDAWDEGRTDNVKLAKLILRLVSGSIEADLRVLLARKAYDLDQDTIRWIDALHEDANGAVWTTKAELRAHLVRAVVR